MGPGQPKKIVLAGNLHKTGEIKAPHGRRQTSSAWFHTTLPAAIYPFGL